MTPEKLVPFEDVIWLAVAEVTVTVAFPVMFVAVADTVQVVGVVGAVKTPVAFTEPHVAPHVGEMETVLLFESRPVAVKFCVPPADTLAEEGLTATEASDPATVATL